MHSTTEKKTGAREIAKRCKVVRSTKTPSILLKQLYRYFDNIWTYIILTRNCQLWCECKDSKSRVSQNSWTYPTWDTLSRYRLKQWWVVVLLNYVHFSGRDDLAQVLLVLFCSSVWNTESEINSQSFRGQEVVRIILLLLRYYVWQSPCAKIKQCRTKVSMGGLWKPHDSPNTRFCHREYKRAAEIQACMCNLHSLYIMYSWISFQKHDQLRTPYQLRPLLWLRYCTFKPYEVMADNDNNVADDAYVDPNLWFLVRFMVKLLLLVINLNNSYSHDHPMLFRTQLKLLTAVAN
jgi:hypothetical protein